MMQMKLFELKFVCKGRDFYEESKKPGLKKEIQLLTSVWQAFFIIINNEENTDGTPKRISTDIK